jgi:hypothetical protein
MPGQGRFGMTMSTRAVSSVSAAQSPPRRAASRLIASEAFASILEGIEEAPPPASVASPPSPVAVSAVPSGDRAILMQFIADLAAAPDVTGELVALYIEQHPRLAVWFAARAVRFRADAAGEIEAAARWREVCGAVPLAELIRAALAIACPPEPQPDAAPAVILDLDMDLDAGDLDDWEPGAL